MCFLQTPIAGVFVTVVSCISSGPYVHNFSLSKGNKVEHMNCIPPGALCACYPFSCVQISSSGKGLTLFPQMKPTVDDFAILVSDGHFCYVSNLEVSNGGRETRMSVIRLLPRGTSIDAGFRPDILGSIELLLQCWSNRKLDMCTSRMCRGYGPGSTRYLGNRPRERPPPKMSPVLFFCEV
jgi:hypothetical protein